MIVMKAVVLAVREQEAVVLTEAGDMKTIRRKCEVGDTLVLRAKPSPSSRMVKWSAAVAAVFLLCFATLGYVWSSVLTCATVSLDVNPSIEYAVNRQDCVISVKAVNKDAEPIVAELKDDIMGISLSDAISKTKALLYKKGYLGKGKDNCILTNVATDDKSIQDKLKDEIKKAIGQDESLMLSVTTSTMDEAKEAEALGMSSGRYKEMLIAQQSGGTPSSTPTGDTVNNYTSKPVKEMIAEHNQNAAQAGTSSSPSKANGDGSSDSGNGGEPGGQKTAPTTQPTVSAPVVAAPQISTSPGHVTEPAKPTAGQPSPGTNGGGETDPGETPAQPSAHHSDEEVGQPEENADNADIFGPAPSQTKASSQTITDNSPSSTP